MLLSHHHVSFFVLAAAVAVTFATVVVIADVAARAPQFSLPQSPMLGNRRPSAIVDGVIIVIVNIVVVIVHLPRAADAIINIDDNARLVHSALGGSRPDP